MMRILNRDFNIDRRQILKFGAAATLGELATISGPGLSRAQAAPKTLRIGSFFVAIDYAPYLIAKAKGDFDSIGGALSTEYTMFQSLPPINEAFATEQIDAIFEAAPPTLIASAAGIDVKIVGISCSLVQDILVPMSSKAKAVADLKGSKIAVLSGTSSHYGILKMLAEAGIASGDVEIIDMAPPDAKSAFETGQVDAWAVWPPFVQQEELAGAGRVLPKGDAVIHSIMAVSGSWAKKNTQTVRALVKTLHDTKTWIIQHPADAQAIVATQLDIPVAVVKRAWPSHDWTATLDDAVIADIQAKADFLYDHKYVGSKINVAKQVIDKSYS